jgi:LacI family transcriptional regulator
MKNSTIRDVAKKSGCSVSTVSHVINGTRHVEEKTRQRVLKAIKVLDYSPNMFARSLKGKETKTLGVIISDIREDFFSELTKSVESRANELGYSIILCDCEEDTAKESFSVDMLLRKGVDGIILAPVDENAAPRVPRLGDVPVVQIDRKCGPLEADFFGIDNSAASTAAVSHLLSHGYTRIGFVGFETTLYTMRHRIEGFRLTLADRGLARASDVLLIESRGDLLSDPVKDWLQENRGFQALVCGNTNLCFAAMEALDDLGLSVPRDVAIVSFDDSKWLRFLACPVTAIRQPTARIGRDALDRLIERIGSTAPMPHEDFLLPFELVIRGSCGLHS